MVLSDNDEVAKNTANAMKDVGIIDYSVDSKTIETKRKDLERKGLYFFPNGCDFETYMFQEGHTQEYEDSISKIFGQGTFETYKRNKIKKDAQYAQKSKEEQIKDFIKSRGKKPALAFEVANKITSFGTDSKNIPNYFRLVLQHLVELTKMEVNDSNEYTRNGSQ